MTKSTITRERAEQLANFKGAPVTRQEEQELARIALVAMDSDPVAYTDERNLGYIDRGRETAYLWGKQNSEASDVAHYRHAHPAPEAMLECFRNAVSALESLYRNGQKQCWNERYTTDMAYASGVLTACRYAMLQAEPVTTANKLGNSPEHSGIRPAQDSVVPALAKSREHFISLCNEFWNWSEMDMVCAEDRGYELRMEWGGKVFSHPVTQALWRMYQAAPCNSPVIGIDPASGPDRTVEVRYVAPPGYAMVPKEPTDEMINAWLSEVANWRGHVAGYKAMLAAAPQEVGDA